MDRLISVLLFFVGSDRDGFCYFAAFRISQQLLDYYRFLDCLIVRWFFLLESSWFSHRIARFDFGIRCVSSRINSRRFWLIINLHLDRIFLFSAFIGSILAHFRFYRIFRFSRDLVDPVSAIIRCRFRCDSFRFDYFVTSFFDSFIFLLFVLSSTGCFLIISFSLLLQ